MDFDTKTIDMDELEGAKAILKTRFSMLTEGYLEDAEMYLKGIEQGLEDDDLVTIAQNAHPLKSSSASLGVTSVSVIAKAIEEKAKTGEDISTIEPIVDPLKEAIEYATTSLKALIAEG